MPWTGTLATCLSLAAAVTVSPATGDDLAAARDAMVDGIAEQVQQTSLYLDRAALPPRVLGALRRVPRHEFVPRALCGRAYANRPLPIGHGQTISQPYIVAVMTDLLGSNKHPCHEPPGTTWRIRPGQGWNFPG